MILVIAGKSASGKDTLKNALVERGMEFIPSDTTRPMREGEKEGEQYHFITDKEWNDSNYIESKCYTQYKDGKPIDCKFGTPKIYNDRDKLFVFIKDKKGALALRNYYGKEEVYTVYLSVPYEVRKQRAMERAEKNGETFDMEEWLNRKDYDDIEFKGNVLSFADIVLDDTNLPLNKDKYNKSVDDLYTFMDSMKEAYKGFYELKEKEKDNEDIEK